MYLHIYVVKCGLEATRTLEGLGLGRWGGGEEALVPPLAIGSSQAFLRKNSYSLSRVKDWVE